MKGRSKVWVQYLEHLTIPARPCHRSPRVNSLGLRYPVDASSRIRYGQRKSTCRISPASPATAYLPNNIRTTNLVGIENGCTDASRSQENELASNHHQNRRYREVSCRITQLCRRNHFGRLELRARENTTYVSAQSESSNSITSPNQEWQSCRRN